MWSFRSKANTSPALCLVAMQGRPYIPNMMFEKSDKAPSPVTEGLGGFENDLETAQPIGERLHDHLPLFLLLVGVVALFFGLHGAGTAVLGAAGAHVVLALVLMVIARVRTRGER